MQLLAALSVLGAVAASVVGAVYYYKYRLASANLKTAESTARALGVMNADLRDRLTNLLDGLKAKLDKEAKDEKTAADTVTDAGGAADFLNRVVRSHS